MDIAVLLLSMCFFFAIGMPIAYALALSALVGALWIDLPVGAVMQQLASGVGKVSMLTIPFFVLAGAIMAEGGMARRLVDFAAVVVGFTRIRGGLSQVNILATTIMSGISGSSVADTSAIRRTRTVGLNETLRMMPGVESVYTAAGGGTLSRGGLALLFGRSSCRKATIR